MSWSTQRQLLIVFLLFFWFGGGAGIYYYFFLKTPVSCFDGKMNQGELDIDCGGPCSEICESEILPLSVEWVRSFKLLNGKYDVAALIVNRNSEFGIPNFKYNFSVMDENNTNVTDKDGSVFINPSEKVLIFASGLDSGKRSISKAFLEYEENKKQEGWIRVGDISDKPRLSVNDEKIVDGDTPRVYANILNSSPYDIKNIEVSAIVYDENNNAIAVSRTMIDVLAKDSTKQVSFTWPSPFTSKGIRADILPRIDYISENNR